MKSLSTQASGDIIEILRRFFAGDTLHSVDWKELIEFIFTITKVLF